MNHTAAPFLRVLVVAAAFGLGLMPRAHADGNRQCSNATLQGAFGYTATGTLVPPITPPVAGPFGEVGRQTFDGKGNTAGSATLNANGSSAAITVTGTYTVNPDCTGTMTLNVAPIGIVTQSYLVIDNDGKQIRVISTDAGTVETRVYTKQFQGED